MIFSPYFYTFNHIWPTKTARTVHNLIMHDTLYITKIGHKELFVMLTRNCATDASRHKAMKQITANRMTFLRPWLLYNLEVVGTGRPEGNQVICMLLHACTRDRQNSINLDKQLHRVERPFQEGFRKEYSSPERQLNCVWKHNSDFLWPQWKGQHCYDT